MKSRYIGSSLQRRKKKNQREVEWSVLMDEVIVETVFTEKYT